jgi:bifunctional enzyme CysN/CysC
MSQAVLEADTSAARNMDLLRFATAGSVDDGKSTLIGRLLYDTKTIFSDQLESVEAVSAARGDEYTNLALLTDGLRAEREQGITIDVAYRYFATPRRKFIIADTPGHIQYTRNMVTGASTADLALILVDARKGLFAAKLDAPDLTVIPISALNGDNIASRSDNSPWYEGPSLLHHLEHVHIASDRNLVDVRFPVQYVIRPQSTTVTDYRGYAGQVASGVLKPGDEVMVLPSGMTSTIAAIDTADGPVDEAFPPMSVTVRLADEIDISRGDMICRPHNAPAVAQDIEAMICWMDETAPLRVGAKYTIKHTTRTARTVVRGLQYRLDVNTLHRDEDATELVLNEIGRVKLRTTVPLLADEYRRNRTTGGFVLIDEGTNRTVGAGMILEAQ